jgi:Flp pilus assembly protein TadG
MLPPLIHRPRSGTERSSNERGFTMALVAVALLSIVAMAALSIDVGTLYQAKAEAQRAADAAALTAARVISISGITGDPTNKTDSWQKVCGGEGSPASLAAINVAQQNLIGGSAASTVKVYYGTNSGGGTNEDCSGAKSSFGVNPIVKVYVQQAKLPTFFARVFSLIPGGTSSNSGVSATASAEAFNPSDSADAAGKMIPVQPRCVKPWVIPNIDPNGGSFVNTGDGSVSKKGILQLGVGVIGETVTLTADCVPGAANCELPLSPAGHIYDNPPGLRSPGLPPPPVPYLEYVPALVSGTPRAIPSCSPAIPATGYQPAIAGCDQNTVYACGTVNGSLVDLTENPVNPAGTGDTAAATQCLIHQSAGPDTLVTTNGKGTVFPFQIQAGSGNPLVGAGVSSDDVITSSDSIVTLPIADFAAGPMAGTQPSVTITGFLQVFINNVVTTGSTAGNITVTVLNVAGCSSATTNPPVFGTSPVPVRLITPP